MAWMTVQMVEMVEALVQEQELVQELVHQGDLVDFECSILLAMHLDLRSLGMECLPVSSPPHRPSRTYC